MAYRPVAVGARCPTGLFAFTGGAHISADDGDSSPAYRGYLTTSNMAADDRGWIAAGYSFAAGTRERHGHVHDEARIAAQLTVTPH